MMSLGQFIGHLGLLAAEIEEMNHFALETACQVVEDEAKSGMGNYKFGFPPLKPETIARKKNGDTPLVETGELKGSVQHNVSGHSGYVGTDNMKGVWNFNGTSRGIPPRDPIKGAVEQSGDKVEERIGRPFAAWLGGEGLPKTRIR
jgi:hypothetical protein